MTALPSLSIIIPAYNEAAFLKGLLASLNEYLEIPFEVVVVNNGSTDATGEIATAFGCHHIKLEKKVFPSVARNLGVKNAKSELIAFLDADILITKQWADEAKALCMLEGDLLSHSLVGDTYQISKAPSWIEKYWFSPLRSGGKKYLNGGNILTSRSLHNKISGFNELLETGEDVDYSQRAIAAGYGVEFRTSLYVHHEGFPKDIKNFFRREKWHGRGDWVSFKHVINSKVALIALLFLFAYLAFVFYLGAAVTYGNGPKVSLLLAPFVLLFGICLVVSLLKFRKFGAKTIFVNSFLYFTYFNARMLSLFS